MATNTTSVSASTNSALVSTGVVAASSVSATSATNSTSSSVSKGAAAGLVANPVSWKYGIAILVSTIGSYILGSEF